MVFLVIIGVLAVGLVSRAQYIKRKQAKRKREIFAMLQNARNTMEDCCKTLEPVLRPAVVTVKPKRRSIKKVVKKGKKKGK